VHRCILASAVFFPSSCSNPRRQQASHPTWGLPLTGMFTFHRQSNGHWRTGPRQWPPLSFGATGAGVTPTSTWPAVCSADCCEHGAVNHKPHLRATPPRERPSHVRPLTFRVRSPHERQASSAPSRAFQPRAPRRLASRRGLERFFRDLGVERLRTTVRPAERRHQEHRTRLGQSGVCSHLRNSKQDLRAARRDIHRLRLGNHHTGLIDDAGRRDVGARVTQWRVHGRAPTRLPARGGHRRWGSRIGPHVGIAEPPIRLDYRR
jgi:hypothetical protein